MKVGNSDFRGTVELLARGQKHAEFSLCKWLKKLGQWGVGHLSYPLYAKVAWVQILQRLLAFAYSIQSMTWMAMEIETWIPPVLKADGWKLARWSTGKSGQSPCRCHYSIRLIKQNVAIHLLYFSVLMIPKEQTSINVLKILRGYCSNSWREKGRQYKQYPLPENTVYCLVYAVSTNGSA